MRSFGAKKRDGAFELELMDHIAELRTRIIRSALYALAGTIVAWYLYKIFFTLLSAPVSNYLLQHGGTFLVTGVMEGFMMKTQVSIVVGLMLSFPFIAGEGWGFVAPGLTAKERRSILFISPLSILLFACGILLAYFVLPTAIKWLASQNPPGATYMPSVQQTILFIVKMCLAFGLVFQLPVVLMFLARVGVINSKMLTAYWRHSVVGISIIAATVTPSNDAFSMLMMCIPMVILYFISIWLVRLTERKQER